MLFNRLMISVALQLVLNSVCDSFDPFSITSAVVAGAGYLVKYVGDKTYCKMTECCNDVHISADFDMLQKELDVRVYGQHLVKRTVVDALRAHWNSPHSRKALTLSFHGRPGTGKNYVSKFVVQSMFTQGSNSQFVHHFMGRLLFPNQDKTEEYKKDLYSWIKGNVSSCPYQVFIFDEVDKMPAGVLDVLKPLIDYNENVEKVDYRKSVFIFLSNTGSMSIIDEALKLWREGKSREEIKLSDFDQLIAVGAFNEKGGFHHSDTIRSNLIDHYIPFLPLEREHVKLCIKDEFAIRGIASPKEEHIKEVFDFITWGPEPENKFANTGCKRLSQQIALIVEKFYTRKDD